MITIVSLLLKLALLAAAAVPEEPVVPICHEDGVTIELFAEHPLLVTPTGIAVDGAGRVFVAESHTHFRPDDYEGLASDRILILRDSDGDGRAEQRTIFHEGFTHVMDLEFDASGALFVATRMDIHRLRDTTGDGVADEVVPIVRMETTGTYPHNGISGLCFNADGSLNFGLGENLGHDYTLVGTDDVRLSGGGEGGSTYHVQADGRQLRRVTTGWWNPYGMCVDSYGRVFGTDNDPGASPPCRLIQVHDGADYGYEYRYGRTGLHPLISWTGDLPGNIPMIAGTGEAPCGILSTERTNLPRRLRDDLLVACWADHRIERYDLSQPSDRGQVQAERHVLVTGGNEFRPVGLAIAPNGDVFVSDWVSASYQLHGLGRVWRIRGHGSSTEKRSESPRAEAEAYRKQSQLWQQVRQLMRDEPQQASTWAGSDQPMTVRAEAVRRLSLDQHPAALLAAARNADQVLRHSAIQALSQQTQTDEFERLAESPTAAVLLAMKRSPRRDEFATSGLLERALKGENADVWGVAVKWIADDLLIADRAVLEQEFHRETLTVRQYLMLSAAIDRLDGNKPSDAPSDRQLTKTALDEANSLSLRAVALRLLNPDSRELTLDALLRLSADPAESLRMEAVRQLGRRKESAARSRLLELATDSTTGAGERVEAVSALAESQNVVADELFLLAADESPAVATAALQSLYGVPVTDENRQRLRQLADQNPEIGELADRVSGKKPDRPDPADTAAWLSLLDGTGDAQAGERIFFHAKIGTCGRCHQHGGRGNSVGPSLSLIARRLSSDKTEARRWLLETILQPSKDMAPQYTPWTIVTTDGRQLTGLPRRKGGSQEAYLGVDGREFTVRKAEIEFHQESRTSIMPAGLLQNLTPQELRNLFAFLEGSG